jgi:hypothetical protein
MLKNFGSVMKFECSDIAFEILLKVMMMIFLSKY